MGDTKTKTKAAMLNELESIKGLLLEEDGIPILQEEVLEQSALQPAIEPLINAQLENKKLGEKTASTVIAEPRIIREEQQDFFNSPIYETPLTDINYTQLAQTHSFDSANELLDTLNDLEKHTEEVTTSKLLDNQKFARPSLAKATGENPFLPEHIRARLHGNNPPPLFANETARKISNTSVPSRQLGNTFGSSAFNSGTTSSSTKVNNYQQDIIDSIIDKMMPDIEKELRNRLETMSKNMLDELNK